MGDPMGSFKVRTHQEAVQQTLFEQTDLVIPDTLRTFRKSVAAVYAVPMRSDSGTTLLTRRLMDAVILVVQLDCKTRGPNFLQRIQTERVSPIFEVTISNLAELAGIPGKNYQRVYQGLDELFETVMRWNILGDEKMVEFEMRSHLFSMIGFGQNVKRGLIRFSIDPAILSIVMEPSIWASLSLGAMHNLKSSASYALYQATWRYVSTPAKCTAALPTYTWIEIMMGQSRHVATDPDGTKRVVDYSDFKRRVLNDALARINEAPALAYTLELREFKKGPRVTRLQFKFVPKLQSSLDMPMTWPDDLKMTLRAIGMTDKDIQDLAESVSQEVAAEAVMRLKAAEDKKRSLGLPMFNRRRYFEGIVANLQAGVRASEITEEVIAQQIREQDAIQQKEARDKLMKARFEEHARAVFKEAIGAMEDGLREALFAAFEKTPEGARAKSMFIKGDDKPIPAPYFALLRDWMTKNMEGELRRMLPDAQDRTYEDWLVWRASAV